MHLKHGTTYLIRNQTPLGLVLETAETTLKFAPLQGRQISEEEAVRRGCSGHAAQRDQVLDWEMQPVRSVRIMITAGLAAAGITALVVGGAGALLGQVWWPFVTGALVALAGGTAGVLVIRAGQSASEEAAARTDGWSSDGPSKPKQSEDRNDTIALLKDFGIATSQGLAAVILVFVAVAAPACAIYFGTEVSAVVTFDGTRITIEDDPAAQYIVVVRTLQLILLILVCLVPALMYFQFDRERLSTMVDRWLHAIFRLDPSLRTISDVDAKYGRRVEEFYGASLGAGAEAPRKHLRDRSPVVICTLLIAIGWIMVLLNSKSRNGGLPTPQELFQPDPTPMTLAFLGAYFLSVQVALRGYLRGDLKPKTYNVIIVRIIMAIVLAWAMQVLWGNDNYLVLGLSFLAGIVPNTVLRKIRDRSIPGFGTKNDDLSPQSPLTELDEMDLYERTRLEEEGITSVQALARHDLVDLMLSSRIPIPRLVDWVDQSILQQHLDRESAGFFRKLGIRNATDFLNACENEAANELLTDACDANPGGIRVEVLTVILATDEWLPYIRNWRRHDGSPTVAVLHYRNGTRLYEPAVATWTSETPHQHAGTVTTPTAAAGLGTTDPEVHDQVAGPARNGQR